jgi:hypothetical protein
MRQFTPQKSLATIWSKGDRKDAPVASVCRQNAARPATAKLAGFLPALRAAAGTEPVSSSGPSGPEKPERPERIGLIYEAVVQVQIKKTFSISS